MSTKQTKAELQAELDEARQKQGTVIRDVVIHNGTSVEDSKIMLALASAVEENAKAIGAIVSFASAGAGGTGIKITGDVTNINHYPDEDTE